MVENHHPDNNESKPLTTETEVLAPEATADHTGLSSESTSTQPHETAHGAPSAAAQHAPPAAAARASADHGTVATVTAGAGDEADDDLNYDAADFAAALANFDPEQAAKSPTPQNLTLQQTTYTRTHVTA